MLRRTLFVLAIATGCAIGAVAIAKNSGHHNGHNALHADANKLKDGKHQIGKHGKHAVFAEVKNKKVVSMSADGLPVRKVKSNKKMAGGGPITLASNGGFEIAQAEVYYGYCFVYSFEDGVDEHCYWYTADDVFVDDTWVWYSA